MKRTETYQKLYACRLQEGEHGHDSLTDSLDDNIVEDISRACLALETVQNPVTYSVRKRNYLWQENGLFQISISKQPARIQEEYIRQIEIETMPETAEIPEELRKLIHKYEFVRTF